MVNLRLTNKQQRNYHYDSQDKKTKAFTCLTRLTKLLKKICKVLYQAIKIAETWRKQKPRKKTNEPNQIMPSNYVSVPKK